MKANSFKQVIVYFLVCCMFFNTSLPVVLAGPEGAEVVNGQVTFQQNGNNTVITASDQSIINYTSFDIARPEVVQFIQPSSNASVLNRINSANPTTINGTLLANGRVYFLNPAGVLIGSSARINVSQLVASGLDMSDADFLEDRMEFMGGNGILVNNGEIIADSVYLVGQQVINAGNIICPSGHVVMASGDRVFIGEPDSHIIVEVGNLEQPDLLQIDSQIINDGLVEVGDGKIILAVAGDALAIPAMANTGILSAANIEGDAGTIDLQADGGRIENTGSIIATSDPGTGGTVTADAAEVVNSETIDVSGTDGGSISLEGGKVGQFGIASADGTTGNGGDIDLVADDVVALSSDSVTTANAGVNGDGGEVIVYSPDTALFRSGAQIEAKGGSESGDGGFIEVSGKKHVEVQGQIDLAATDGESGTFLIDPYNITIDDSDDDDGILAAGQWDPTVEDSRLGIENLISYLEAADVTISTEGDGLGEQEGDVVFDFYNEGGDYSYLHNGESGNSLTVIAADDIEFRANNRIVFWSGGDVKLYAGPEGGITSVDRNVFTVSTRSGDIIMEAGRGGIHVGMLQIGTYNMDDYMYDAGEIRLRTFNPGGTPLKGEGDYDITTQDLIVYGYGEGSIDVSSAGNLTIDAFNAYYYYDGPSLSNGDVYFPFGDAVFVETYNTPEGPDASAFACLTAKKDVTINGNVTVNAFGWETAEAAIRIGAGADRFPGGIITDTYDGTVTINGNLKAEATTYAREVPYPRESEATIQVYAKTINLNGDTNPMAIADKAFVQTDTQGSDEVTGEDESHALAAIDIDNTKDGTCLDCDNRLPEPEPEPPIIIVTEEAGFSDDLRPPELSDIGRVEGDFAGDLQWLAEELGLCQSNQPGEDENQCQEITQAYLADAFLHATDLRPYQAASQLRNLVAILHDSEGARTAALTRVVNEFASPDAPPNPEQMASIASALSSHQNDGTHYASAGQWLDALVEYAGILNRDIGWSTDESVAFVMGKYGTAVTEAGDINVTAFIQMRLEGVSG